MALSIESMYRPAVFRVLKALSASYKKGVFSCLCSI